MESLMYEKLYQCIAEGDVVNFANEFSFLKSNELNGLEINHVFLNSVENNEIEIIRYLLKFNIGRSVFSFSGETVLHTMVLRRNFEFIEFLLKNGFDVDRRDDRGYTSLINSIYGGDKEIIQFLLNWGADLEVKTPDETPGDALRRKGFTEFL